MGFNYWSQMIYQLIHESQYQRTKVNLNLDGPVKARKSNEVSKVWSKIVWYNLNFWLWSKNIRREILMKETKAENGREEID